MLALQWTSHGLHYGLGLDTWLTRGLVVVANGSRAHLLQAAQRYPALLAVHVDAHPEVLAERLAMRGRETQEEVSARLARRIALRC